MIEDCRILIAFSYQEGIKPSVPAQSVYVGYADTFAESNNQKRNIPTEAIKKDENIIPGTMGEYHGQDAANAAKYSCEH